MSKKFNKFSSHHYGNTTVTAQETYAEWDLRIYYDKVSVN